MSYVRAIFLILVGLFVVVLAVQNHEAMLTKVTFKLNLLFVDYESAPMSLYLVSVITFLAGVFFCGIFGVVERFRLSKQVKVLRRESAEKDKELSSLRNLPVTSEGMEEESLPPSNEPA
jgi:uncharacterized integral membrane protein